MRPRITLITLAVDDLEKSLAFYRDGLGWRTEGIVGQQFEHGAVAFFDLEHGLRLALWKRASLAHDAGSRRARAAPPSSAWATTCARAPRWMRPWRAPRRPAPRW